MTNRDQLYRYKGNRCGSCGINVQEMVDRYGTFSRMFQFHHVDPSTKDGHYRRLMAQRLSRRQMDEIDKCVLLCTQCHSIMHAQEIKATLELSVEIDRRIVRQLFNGWVRVDRIARQAVFVTNQPYLLELCEVRIGNEEPVLLFIVEIETYKNLFHWLQNIDEYRTVEIASVRDKKRFMRIRHEHGRTVKITQALGMPIAQLDFYPTDLPNEIIFFRNGVVLTASGEIHTSGQVTYDCHLTSEAFAVA